MLVSNTAYGDLMVKDRTKKKTYAVRIPSEVHYQLKLRAANENTTLQKIVGKACTDLVMPKDTETTKIKAFSSDAEKSENPFHPKKK